MEEKVIVQKIKKNYVRAVDIGVKYYSILSLLNDLKLADREIQLLAHTATKGTISTIASKNEFIKLFPGATIATINNLMTILKRKKFLVKDGKMTRVHPAIAINFSKVDKFVLNITCILPKELMTK